MINLIAAAVVFLSVNADATAFKKKVDPAKLHRELTAAGCQVSSISTTRDDSGDVVSSCSSSKVAEVIAAHVYSDRHAELVAELGALEDQLDAGVPLSAAQSARFNKLILILLGLSKNP